MKPVKFRVSGGGGGGRGDGGRGSPKRAYIITVVNSATVIKNSK